MGIFSKELLELDRNTVQYMIDDMQDTINEQKDTIQQQTDEITVLKQQLAKLQAKDDEG